MELAAEEAVQARQTRRIRVKTIKAVEWENTGRMANASRDTDEDNILGELAAPGAPRQNRT